MSTLDGAVHVPTYRCWSISTGCDREECLVVPRGDGQRASSEAVARCYGSEPGPPWLLLEQLGPKARHGGRSLEAIQRSVSPSLQTDETDQIHARHRQSCTHVRYPRIGDVSS